MSDANAAPEQESPVKPSDPTPMVRGPRGGMLRRGGTNRGGPGRTPSALKARLRRDFFSVAPLLKEFALAKGKDADGKPMDLDIKMSDRIRAIDVMAKHGLDQAVTLTDVREALRQTRETIGEHMDREKADALWSQIIPFWLAL